MQKKLTSFLLTFCLLLGMFPFAVGTSAAETAATFADSDGDGWYELSSADDLKQLADLTAAGDAARGGQYVLTADIDMSVLTGQLPIGTATYAFTGKFNGNGKTVSGIRLVAETATNNYAFFGRVAGAEIFDLTVAGEVRSAGQNVGGLVGNVASGATIAGCTNLCTVVGGLNTAGLVGYAASKTGTLTLTNCKNGGDVTGTRYVGGMLGQSLIQSGKLTVTGCLNTGAVTATAQLNGNADLGGIAGLVYSLDLANCMNTGAVTTDESVRGTATKSVGGVVGRAAPTAASTLAACYNACFVTAANPYAVIGHKQGAGTLTASGNYRAAGAGIDLAAYPATELDTAAFESGGDCKNAAELLDAAMWTFTPNGPELTAFHVHDAKLAVRLDNERHWFICDCYGYTGDGVNAEAHSFGADGLCTVCGTEKTDCTHAETYTEELTASTCATAGIGNEVCAECGIVLKENVALPLNPEVHEGEAEITRSADGKIAYKCSACGGIAKVESRAPLGDIYVLANGVALRIAYIPDTIGTQERPFASAADAFAYAAAAAPAGTAVTLHVVDTVDLPVSYKMPEFEGTLTVTGGTLHFAGTSLAQQSLYLGGDTTFTAIGFTSAVSGTVIYAQNHKLTMGEGIRMLNDDAGDLDTKIFTAGDAKVNGVKMYIYGGFASADAPEKMTTDVTVRSGEYWEIAGWNHGDNGTAGTASLTLGKTDASDTLLVTYVVPFSDTSTNSLKAASAATVRVDGDADIARVYLNTAAGGSADVAYTTDFLLLGSINGGANYYNYLHGYDLSFSAGVKTATVHVYTDMRSDAAKENAYPFFGNGAEIAPDDATTRAAGHTFTSAAYSVYCKDVLGGHADADNDGACDTCGAAMLCPHDAGYVEADTVASTCVTAGSVGHKCVACGTIYERVPLPLDAQNHEQPDYVWHEDSGVYYQLCKGCGKRHTETETLPTVYVDNLVRDSVGGLSLFIGNDANSGATAETAVKTLPEAVTRLAETGGTVILADYYRVGANLTLPAYAKPITFTSVTFESGAPRAGFEFTASRKAITLGGPTVFKTIKLDATYRGTVMNANGGNTPFLIADWNNVTMESGVETYGMLMFVGGRYGAATNDDTAKTVQFTFAGVTAKEVGADDAKTTYPSFRYLYLGDAEAKYLGGDKEAAENITVANKTVAAVLDGVTAQNVVTVSASSAPVSVRTADNAVSLTLAGACEISNLYTGWSNTSNKTTGDAFVDTLAIEIGGNAVVTTGMRLYNARNLTLNIAAHDAAHRITAPIQILLNDVYAPTGTEHATLTYGTHSIDGKTALPTVGDGYTATVHKTEECTFGDWVIQDSTKTRTCSACGRTETAAVPSACTYHRWLPTDAGYVCTVCSETQATLTAPAALRIESVSVADGEATVVLSFASTVNVKGLRFKVLAPDGFTYKASASTLPAVSDYDADKGEFGLMFAEGTTSMLLFNLGTASLASFEKSNVLTLTYTVSENFTAQSADFTVNLIEVLDDNAASLAADGVGYTWTAAIAPETYVAYIGEVGYTTVQAAFDAAKALDTITVAAGTTETVEPKTTVYLAGDYSGITIGGAYTLEVMGRYVRRDGAVVSDSKVAFMGESKAIVRPAGLTSAGEARGGKTLNLGASVEYLFRPKKNFVDPLADFYVKLELLGADGKSVEEGSADAYATTLIMADKKVAESDATRYAYVLDAVPAPCMNNTIRYTQYCVDADGTVTVYVSNFGANAYFKSMLQSATGGLRDLLVALINYGTLAQQQFGYNTENPLSNLLSEADRKLTTADYADIDMQQLFNYTQRTDDNYSFESFNTTLELLDRINILVTVKSRAGLASDFAGVKAVYSYTDIITGKTITNAVPFENWVAGSVDAKGRMAYRVSINDIAAVNLRQAITLDVVDASGTSIYKFQDVSFNAAEYYCAQQAGNTTTLATLCYSIMNYCNKAAAYFAK